MSRESRPKHRATQQAPAQSFRYGVRAFTDEDRWSWPGRPAQHRVRPLNPKDPR